MANAYIYINVVGVGYKALHFPKNPTQEKRLLRGVRNWESGKDFDSYDPPMSIRVIDMDGNVLYKYYTGHAWDVAGHVEDAIWCVNGCPDDSDTES